MSTTVIISTMEITEESFKVTASSAGDYISITSKRIGGGEVGINKKDIDILIECLEKIRDFKVV